MKRHINEFAKTSFSSQGGRAAGIGITEEDYSEDSFPCLAKDIHSYKPFNRAGIKAREEDKSSREASEVIVYKMNCSEGAKK